VKTLDTAELAKLIKTRRSIRVFQDKPVPEALLIQAVELATWAPNGGNGQNWRWYIILDN
jgi:nitroreductase